MLFEAFHWNPSTSTPDPIEFRRDPEFAKLLADWPKRPGDTAVVAEDADRSIGGAWYRSWTDDEHSYGFVAPEYPEVAIAVEASWRSSGVGRALLTELCRVAREALAPGLSLSVDPANHAAGLYASLGFREVGISGTSVTMLLDFDADSMEPDRSMSTRTVVATSRGDVD